MPRWWWSGRERWEVAGGLQIERVTERVQGSLLDRQADDASKQADEGRQAEGGRPW